MHLSKLADRPLHKGDHLWKDWSAIAILWLIAVISFSSSGLEWDKHKNLRFALSGLSVISSILSVAKMREIQSKSFLIAQRKILLEDMYSQRTIIKGTQEHERFINELVETAPQPVAAQPVSMAPQNPYPDYSAPTVIQEPVTVMQPPATIDIYTETESGIPLFNWEDFRTNRNKYPHIGIAGKTGGGKSWLAEYLASLFDGVVVAIAPHWNAGDFTSANLVVGWGRNFGSIDDCKRLSFAEVMSGKHNVSACGFMGALIKEMDRRYQLTPQQTFVGETEPEIVVILDEFNAWAKHEKELPEITSKLLREARKVKIRLIPLVQGTEVEAMGCKGQGQLREQLTWVQINNKAQEYCSSQYRLAKQGTDDHEYWGEVCDLVASQPFPAFVGGLNSSTPCEPAIIPDLTQWKQSQPQMATLAGWKPQSRPQQETQQIPQPTPPAQPMQPDPRQVLENCLAIETCPHCASTKIVGHGATAAGTPRKRCNDCGKTWTTED